MDNSTMFRGSVFYEMGMECDTDEERLELWKAIMEYGLFGKEPPKKFKRDFVNVRFILGKSKEISEIRSEVGKLGGAPIGNKNAVKTWENDIKQPKQAKQPKTSKTSESDSISNSISNNVNKYLEYVYLSNDEYMKLIDVYGEIVINDYIERLNNWIGEKPNSKDRKNRKHYFTILAWLRKDHVKKLPPKPENESGEYENLREQDVYLQNLIKGKQK